ncbi:Subunit G of the mitochondrial F1F0 ATP synthase [Mycena venus]|uniref:Subunit G of the mitochondrial F1F0 ATP synthase n=1 Tax=Mycena venus TaxID=2733690 RepID=A0A8H6Z1T1_9AGAR|nr:Subunit G of the mitochondrial F1F0 ATP synthase [Mycena venus]
MHATVARRALGGLVPPKIATPKLVSGASPTGSGPLAPLVAFYYKLPKGPAPVSAIRGLKARFFSGKNASGVPVLGLIGGIFLVGYTLDYQRALRFSDYRSRANMCSQFVCGFCSPPQAPQEQRALKSESNLRSGLHVPAFYDPDPIAIRRLYTSNQCCFSALPYLCPTTR